MEVLKLANIKSAKKRILVNETKQKEINQSDLLLRHTQRKLKLLFRLMIRKLLLLHLRLLLQKSIELVQRVYSTRIMLQERFLV